MNKTAIKNFAIWARKKLISDIAYKAGLIGITEKEIKSPLPQSTVDMQFFDIGTKTPYSIAGTEIEQRGKLIKTIQSKEKQSDYKTAFKSVVEEVAYTWFNRLIAVRFMEVNDYLPSHIRVLSSESSTKLEPDLVTNPFDANLEFTPYEKDRIMQLKNDNKLDELFRMLFIKQCNALNAILPELFEKTNDYTELLMNASYTDKDSVVYRLVHDIPEDNFNVEKEEGQVEIIGWLYQYYNTELKDETFALLKKNVKISKERIPAATQLFTPDWIVRYMVENSLGRLWLEQLETQKTFDFNYIDFGNFSFGEGEDKEITKKQESLKSNWKYYLEEAEQEEEVKKQLYDLRMSNKNYDITSYKFIDPCMGSGHILVYAFDVFMQIYESCGYSKRDAARQIIRHNIYGLDIDDRAYQLAYFALMMKARQYDRRIFTNETYEEDCRKISYHVHPNLCGIQESNDLPRNIGEVMNKNFPMLTKEDIECIQYVADVFRDAKTYGSILNVDPYYDENDVIPNRSYPSVQLKLDDIYLDENYSLDQQALIKEYYPILEKLLTQAFYMGDKYDVVVTNPPYMGSSGMNAKLSEFVKVNYSDSKSDLFAVFIEKCGQIIKKNGFQAMITQHAWMFLTSFEALRLNLISKTIINMSHLGPRAFDEIGGEVVQTTAFVLQLNNLKNYKGLYVRLVNIFGENEKREVFLNQANQYFIRQNSFYKIPGAPVAYWINKKIASTFNNTLIGDLYDVKQGMTTSDNERFLRLWYEPSINNCKFDSTDSNDAIQSLKKWFPYNKGGEFRKWYGNKDYVVNYFNNGRELELFHAELNKTSSGGRLKNRNFYFKESITWSFISTSKFGVRYSNEGSIFDVAGSSLFPNHNDIFYIIGFLCSSIASNLLQIINPTMNYQAKDIRTLPIVISNLKKEFITEKVKENILLAKKDWDSFETSWDFKKHPLIQSTKKLIDSYNNWQRLTNEQFKLLKANEENLNNTFIEIYGLQAELSPNVENIDITISKADLDRDIRSFISYAIGCLFGRYSLDVEGLAYAGGDWDSSKYSTIIPDTDNVIPITDEEYFTDDIVGLFCDFVKKVYGEETLEENLDFIADALGRKGNTSREVIRNYFLKDFFKDHCKVYQKRPIYWLFDSGSQDGFKALIYMHRYNADTIGNLRIDYLHRMQRVYESEIARMQDTINNSSNARDVAAATKRKEKLTKQLKETKDYDEKIAHLALARIAIDLDDGVKVNYEKVQTDSDGKKLDVLVKI